MREMTDDIIRQWYAVGANDLTNRRDSLPIRGVKHYLNHWVLVTSGEHAGSRVSVISLHGLDPEPSYLVELENGTDTVLRQSELIADAETWKAAEQLAAGDASKPRA